MKYRSKQLEIIDHGPEAYTKKEYDDCLEKLDAIGRWLGGDRATLNRLKTIDNVNSILDVGCGGGQFAIRLAKLYPQTQVLGIDLNPYAIAFAKNKLSLEKEKLRNICFETREEKELKEPSKSFDIVLATLVCHHIPDRDLPKFISDACRVAKKKVILNDLHRHPLALLAFKIISPIFFHNRLIIHDGALSIRRSFTYKEWVAYLNKAGIPKSRYRIKWDWAFRWIVEIDCEALDD